MRTTLRVAARVAILSVLGVLVTTRAASADGMPPSDPTNPCPVDSHINVSAADAAAIADVVCGPIRTNPAAYPGQHRIRVVRIDTKMVVVLISQKAGGQTSENTIVISSLDEITIAGPRLLEAASENKTVEETATVTNIVGDEALKPKKRHSSVHAHFGVIGAGDGRSIGGGLALGIFAGSERWSFVADLRLAGESFNRPAALAAAIFTLGSVSIQREADFSYVSLAGGVRHHFSAGDIAPFVGAGLALDYLAQNRTVRRSLPYGGLTHDERESSGNTGLAAYGELGLDVLRTRMIGGSIVLRADAPSFMLERIEPHPTDPSRTIRTSTYAPVLTAGILLRF